MVRNRDLSNGFGYRRKEKVMPLVANKNSLLGRYGEEMVRRGNFGHADEFIALFGQIEQHRIDLQGLYSARTSLCALIRKDDETAIYKIVNVPAFIESEKREKAIQKSIKSIEQKISRLEPIIDQAVIELPELVIEPTLHGLRFLRDKQTDRLVRLERRLTSETERLLARPKAKLADVLASPEIVALKAQTEEQTKEIDAKVAVIDKFIKQLEEAYAT